MLLWGRGDGNTRAAAEAIINGDKEHDERDREQIGGVEGDVGGWAECVCPCCVPINLMRIMFFCPTHNSGVESSMEWSDSCHRNRMWHLIDLPMD